MVGSAVVPALRALSRGVVPDGDDLPFRYLDPDHTPLGVNPHETHLRLDVGNGKPMDVQKPAANRQALGSRGDDLRRRLRAGEGLEHLYRPMSSNEGEKEVFMKAVLVHEHRAHG